MYWWLAQDLAERGYVVLTYDVQGQGTSETLPHQNDQVERAAVLQPVRDARRRRAVRLPRRAGAAAVELRLRHRGRARLLPLHADAAATRTRTPTTRGQLVQPALEAVRPHAPTAAPARRAARRASRSSATRWAPSRSPRCRASTSGSRPWSRSTSSPAPAAAGSPDQPVKPVVPALGVQSEYGFTVQPYWMTGGSSLTPRPGSSDRRPTRSASRRPASTPGARPGVDTMVIVPRASTHLEYTDIPYALPASRYGQDLDERLRAGVARPLPQAHSAARRCWRRRSATWSRSPSGKWAPVDARAREAAELLLLLGLLAPRPPAGRRRHRRRGRLTHPKLIDPPVSKGGSAQLLSRGRRGRPGCGTGGRRRRRAARRAGCPPGRPGR